MKCIRNWYVLSNIAALFPTPPLPACLHINFNKEDLLYIIPCRHLPCFRFFAPPPMHTKRSTKLKLITYTSRPCPDFLFRTKIPNPIPSTSFPFDVALSHSPPALFSSKSFLTGFASNGTFDAKQRPTSTGTDRGRPGCRACGRRGHTRRGTGDP